MRIMHARQRIRSYRTTHDIPPKDLALRLGIAESTLRSIENGNRKVTPDLAVVIEREIGIPCSEFFPEMFARAIATERTA
jgi:DNA-binding XRE family transcriptional regulator